MDTPPVPRSPQLAADLEPVPGAALRSEATLEDVAVSAEDLAGLYAPDLSLRGVRLQGTQLGGSELRGCELTDVQLRSCDLANARIAPRAGWRRVAAHSCRLTGAVLQESVLRDVTIDDCRVDLVSFAGSRLERVTFRGCRLTQTDFLQAQLDAVSFLDCDLTELDLREATLRRCELRGCELSGLRGTDRLRGAALPWPDIVGAAGIWAQALGIEVAEDS